jgi:hypothetical protein
MITNDQIIEVAKEFGFSFNSAGRWQGIVDLRDIYRFAQHFYRQGLLDAAEKVKADAEMNVGDRLYVARLLRQMAEEIK